VFVQDLFLSLLFWAPALLCPFISPSQIPLYSPPTRAFMLTLLLSADETAHRPLWVETHALQKWWSCLSAGGCGEFCVFFRPTKPTLDNHSVWVVSCRVVFTALSRFRLVQLMCCVGTHFAGEVSSDGDEFQGPVALCRMHKTARSFCVLKGRSVSLRLGGIYKIYVVSPLMKLTKSSENPF